MVQESGLHNAAGTGSKIGLFSDRTRKHHETDPQKGQNMSEAPVLLFSTETSQNGSASQSQSYTCWGFSASYTAAGTATKRCLLWPWLAGELSQQTREIQKGLAPSLLRWHQQEGHYCIPNPLISQSRQSGTSPCESFVSPS